MGSMRHSTAACVLLLLAILFSCGSGRSNAPTATILRSGTLGQDAPGALERELEAYAPDKSINHAGFSLFVLDMWGEIAPEDREHYDFTVRTLMNGDTFVSVYAQDLADSAASLFVLKYNPDEWKLREILPGKLYGGESESIFLAIEKYAGTLPFGLARVRPQDNGLTSGGGLVAEIAFSPRPATGSRAVSVTAGESALLLNDYTIESFGDEAARLSWNDQLRGDYNNNGSVGISDITPIAMYFGGIPGDGQGDDVAEGFIDRGGETDNAVSIAEITPIAMHYGITIDGYNIYRSVDGHPEIPEKKLANLDIPSLEISIGRAVDETFEPAEYFYQDDTMLDDIVDDSTTFIYRIAPVGDTGESDYSLSDTLTIEQGEDTTPPHGPGAPTNPYIGITYMDAGNGRIKIVYKRNAVDNVTPQDQLRYFLYIGPPGGDAGIDLNNSIVIEVTDTDPPYIWESLANGTTYAAYLAAEDEAGNRTSPTGTAVKTCTPSAAARNDFEPPVWVGTVGILTAEPGDHGFRVTFGTAVDAQSPPVRYRVYFSKSTHITYDTAPFIETDSSPFSIVGMGNNSAYTVAVRAIDSADRYDPPISPNEEKNTVTLYVTPSSTAGDVTPPEWDDTVGVVHIMPGEGSMRVEFGPASDADSPPVTYTVYYQEGGAVDFTADTQSVEVDTHFPPTFVTGLTNAQQYTFVVRARDAAGNEEKNTAALTATPDLGLDNAPPEWDTTVGIQVTSAGNGYVDLSWNSATDAQSPPVSYRVYWEEGDQGISDYAQAIVEGRTAVTGDLYYHTDGLINETVYSFAVRAQDSWPEAQGGPNEDYNLVYLSDAPKAGVAFDYDLVYDDPLLPVQYTSLAVASDGSIGVAYAVANEVVPGEFVYALRYATNETGDWVNEEVCGGIPADSRGKMPSLKFDGSGAAHIVFINNSHEYDDEPLVPYTTVEHVTRTAPDTWTAPEIVDGGDEDIVFVNPSLAFDSSDTPSVAYVSWNAAAADDDDRLWYAWFDGLDWQSERASGTQQIYAGGGPGQDGSNCSLAFGTWDIGSVVDEYPSVAYSDPARSGQLFWAVRGGADDWIAIGLDDSSWMTHVDLCLAGETWLPRISYRNETSSALCITQTDDLSSWDVEQADWDSAPGVGFYSNIVVTFQAGYEMLFASSYNASQGQARLCIENLLEQGEYFVYPIQPFMGMISGTYLSMDVLRIGANDKAVVSLVADENLYVSIMK